MNPIFSVRKMIKPGPVKYMTLTVCAVICFTGWLAIAQLQASDDMDDPDVNFQNDAQAQHAHNLAFQAALQDREVARAIACAKKSGNPRDIRRARRMFREKKEDYIEKISDMRASGMGWGNIARQLDVHPSFLGLGHSKYMAKHDLDFTKHARIRSEIKAATARSFKGEANRGHVASGSVSNSKSVDMVSAKGWGQNKSRGLALGHGKSKGGNVSVGRTDAYGNGHGNGHGGGHGNGNGGGHGNGNGGGPK